MRISSFAHRIKTTFVLRMVMGAVVDMLRLCPNDKRSRLKAYGLKASLDVASLAVAMINIGDVTVKKSKRFGPIRSVIIRHNSRDTAPSKKACAPSRVKIDAIRRISHHEVRCGTSQNPVHVGRH